MWSYFREISMMCKIDIYAELSQCLRVCDLGLLIFFTFIFLLFFTMNMDLLNKIRGASTCPPGGSPHSMLSVRWVSWSCWKCQLVQRSLMPVRRIMSDNTSWKGSASLLKGRQQRPRIPYFLKLWGFSQNSTDMLLLGWQFYFAIIY